jgi:protein-tyrosine phosphatase
MFCLDEITPGLFVSDALAASSLSTLKHYKITHILVAGEELNQHFLGQFQYKVLPIADTITFDVSPFFPESNQFIQQALSSRGHVLVHCYLGISRSSTLVIAYVMNLSRMPYTEANRLVRSKHKNSQPNDGFVTQLRAYEKQLDLSGVCCCLM